jgi:molybdenum cofactor guanylyltransferase
MAADRETGSPGGRIASPTALGAVLAGGAGRRLGGSKALAELAGRPLLSYPLEALEEAALEAVVVAKPGSALPPLECQAVREAELPRHPLCGIVAALRHAGGRPVVAVACDMPFASPRLLAALASAAEPLVVPAPGGRLQPLQARYGPELLPALEAALEREEPLRRSVAALGPRLLGDAELSRLGDPELSFFNVNDAGDLHQAEYELRP